MSALLDMSARYTIGRGRPRYQRDVITMEHHYRIDIFLVAVDSQLREMNSRFKENVVELLVLSSALDPRDDYVSFKVDDICKLVNKIYPKDFTE